MTKMKSKDNSNSVKNIGWSRTHGDTNGEKKASSDFVWMELDRAANAMESVTSISMLCGPISNSRTLD